MGDMGVHVIDLIRWHFGEFARVTAQAGVAYPARSAPGGKPTDAEDFCSVMGELVSGGQVTFSVSAPPAGRTSRSWRPTAARARSSTGSTARSPSGTWAAARGRRERHAAAGSGHRRAARSAGEGDQMR